MSEPNISGESMIPDRSLEEMACRLCRRYSDPAARETERIADKTLQDLLSLVIHSYFQRLESREENGPLAPIRPDSNVTATEVVVLVTELLKAVDVEVFELGMWQALGKR
ncbi:MAG: hypothetical protein HYY65_12255 [Candidatus Tectomicrobia bacterium]|uniref:Uncharacterized protein n=1 Tax=Tectimicrobiota bacterium TaxID=2528274 RepID=A0A932GRL7_UNCTE|nr:hypothetical protein [Candidatus Tectomicrobia bacterium]